MSREKGRQESRFLRGAVGVDGAATEEKKDPAELEQAKSRDEFLRGRAWLGREFLTWLLYKSDAGGALAKVDDTGVEALFTGRIVLRGLHGEVHELAARGAVAPYSREVRYALARGLLVHQGRVRLTLGEQVFEVTLDAEHLDVKSAKLPALLTDEQDDRTMERLYLVEKLSAAIDALIAAFMAIRTTRRWGQAEIPALRAWMEAEKGTRDLIDRARAASGT